MPGLDHVDERLAVGRPSRRCRPAPAARGPRPSQPERWSPMPNPPLPAERCGEWWYDSSVSTCGSATSTMSPPWPPLPPSGPARGLNFSRLHGDAAVPALAGAQVQRHAIDECDHALSFREIGPCLASDEEGASRSPPPPRQELMCACDYSAAATMLTTLRPPFCAELDRTGGRARTACRRHHGRRWRRGGSGCRAGGR